MNELTPEERQILIDCMEIAVRNATPRNVFRTAATLLPLVARLSDTQDKQSENSAPCK